MLSKIFTVVAIVLVVILVAGACFFVFTGHKNSAVELVKSSKITIPEEMDDDQLFGLFFYNADGTYTRTTEAKEKVNFDPNKPTMIFFHGVQQNKGYYKNELVDSPEGWIEEGYNVASYFWSQLSDFMPTTCVNGVWERRAIPFKYEKDGEIIEKAESINYTIAECFVAYYVDFMAQYDYKGSQIYFQGLSLGGNLLIAVNSYLLTLNKAGLISDRLLPDRVTYHDTYLTSAPSTLFVPWLNKQIGENGTLKMLYEVSKELISRGVAVEYVASSFVSDLTKLGAGDADLFDEFSKKVTYLNFDASFAGINQGLSHIAGKEWYHKVITEPIYYDYAAQNPEENGIYAPSPKAPISYIYARMGSSYDMEINNTRLTFSDDVIKSTNITAPKVAGFAYFDSNDNGINDDRLFNRINGINVELYDSSDKLVATTTTSNGGYYEFLLEATAIGKNYYVKIALPSGKVVGKPDSGSMLCMGNGIKSDLKSNIVAINSTLDLKIINIGLING